MVRVSCLVRALALACGFVLAACEADLEEGAYGCETGACPEGWFCGSDQRCYSSPDLAPGGDGDGDSGDGDGDPGDGDGDRDSSIDERDAGRDGGGGSGGSGRRAAAARPEAAVGPPAAALAGPAERRAAVAATPASPWRLRMRRARSMAPAAARSV